MKLFRKPSIKKSIKARTTGRIKRKMKKAINPFYGRKGMGWLRDPKRAMYNKVYNKFTFSIWGIFAKLFAKFKSEDNGHDGFGGN